MRQIEVILPREYEAEREQTYEVIYVLDGQYYREQIPYIYRWTLESGYMPQSILVIIPNTFIDGVNQRMRDFTPTRSEAEEYPGVQSGGADRFLEFIQNELDPYINEHYRTSGSRTLIGSSLSGLLVVHAFFSQPDFFTSFVASDPSIWWDDQFVLNMAEKKLANSLQSTCTFWVAGIEDTYEGMGIKKLDSLLQSVGDPRWKCRIYQNETHFSVQHKAFYDGLRFSFLGYDAKMSLRFHPTGGILEEGKSIGVHFFNVNPLLTTTYTTDGSVPTRSSMRLQKNDELIIDKPAKVSIKTFGNRDAYNDSRIADFKSGTAFSPLPDTIFESRASIKYSYYRTEGDDFGKGNKTRQASITIDKNSDEIELQKSKDEMIHRIESNFEVKNEGYYVFGITARGGAKVFIDDSKLIDYEQEGNVEQSFIVPLKLGFHSISLELTTIDMTDEIQFICFYARRGTDDWWQSEPVQILPAFK